ncbi:MAG: DedA family protein [bacterium]|nr:DedA family protein [bacterium]
MEIISWYKKPFMWMRKLYDWVIHWAATPYGMPALCIIAFAESSFFPIPPDVLLIALVLGLPKKAFYFAAICTLGSVTGGMFGYFLGYEFFGVVNWIMAHIVGESRWFGVMHPSATPLLLNGYQFYFYPVGSPYEGDSSLFLQVKNLYDENAFLAIFTASFTPIPYKVFTVTAGYFHVSFPILIVGSILGRGGRFFLVSTLLYFFGPPMKRIIDKYFEWFALAFGVLIIGGFIAIKKLL